MPEINDLDIVAAGNGVAPPNGFPEGMEYSDVNNSAREFMSVIARAYRDENGSLSATGINDLVISTNGAYPALYQGLRLGFRAASTNTGAMTLQVNTLSPMPLLNTAGGPMEAGSIIQNLVHYVVYNGAAFQLVTNGFEFPGGNPGIFTAAAPDVVPEAVDRVALLDVSDSSAPKFATITAIRNATELFNLSNPAAAPDVLDRLHFQDADDLNNPKTATIQQVLNLGFTESQLITSLGNGTYELLGINGAVADTTDRFSIITPSALYSPVTAANGGTGDCQIQIDKETTGDNNRLMFQTGGSTRADIGTLGADDLHLRVSTNGSAFFNALSADASTETVTIGASAASFPQRLTLVGENGEVAVGANGLTQFVISNGTSAGLTINAAANNASYIYGGRPGASGNNAFRITMNHNINAMIFAVPTAAGAAGVDRMAINANGGITVGAPAGLSQGAGTLNALGVYDDGTLLTCYVFDQAIDGSIDPERWDAFAPDRESEGEDGEKIVEKRTHEPVRKFLARIGTEHDPLDMDAYAAHWRDKRHLTSMPNKTKFDPLRGMSTGQWIQALTETVEIQAVHIEQLNQRLKALEAAS